ncbi:MAG TPA: 16S rRNA (adenine(1518)-N(6)/adenine(1519)-N(6))-dimethyltransferase RsmA [Burkholderiales bacterium]|nr:16S rRNA (adenine(1518)-N(6)/adenine(1519)-N(6))-dimethyltransferase RsmA [Burkholderiales bacterium]
MSWVATAQPAIVHRPRRRFAQNFLVDRSYVTRIVQALDPRPEDLVVEIGPGRGAVTGPLLERVKVLHVVEIDRDLCARLSAQYPRARLVVHQGDALRFDFGALGADLRLVGNLPYNISSPLLFRIAPFASSVRDCHFMLQREVVDRMAAAPGSKSYGRLSVMLQYRFRVEKLFNVPAGAFRPTPKVDSAFVRLAPHASLPVTARDEARLSELVAAAFSQRRKTVRNALAAYVDEDQLSELGIDPRLRPENLSLADFVRLANAVGDRDAGRLPRGGADSAAGAKPGT